MSNMTETAIYDDMIEMICIYMQITICGLGILFNGIFLAAIIKRTPEPLKSYAVLLFNFAFVDFLASISSLMAMQRVIFSGFSLAYIFNGACKFVHPYFCYFFHCFNCHAFAHSQWILMVSFIYRYWILVRPTPTRKSVIELSILVYIPSFLIIGIYVFGVSDSEVLHAAVSQTNPEYDLSTKTISGNANMLDIIPLIAIAYMCLPCFGIYTTILIFRQKTLHYLAEAACNLSEETKKTHRKMIKALTIQACIPIFYVAGATQFLLGIFDIVAGPIPENGTFLMMEFMPLITPLISLYFITPYRRAFMDWMGIKSVNNKTAPASGVVSAAKKSDDKKEKTTDDKSKTIESNGTEKKEETDLSLLA